MTGFFLYKSVKIMLKCTLVRIILKMVVYLYSDNNK